MEKTQLPLNKNKNQICAEKEKMLFTLEPVATLSSAHDKNY